MSYINLKRFVDINIVSTKTIKPKSIRDTVVLLSKTGEKGSNNVYNDYNEIPSDLDANLKNYAKCYFDNGGNKLKIISGIQPADLLSTVKSLSNEEIVIAYDGTFEELNENLLKTLKNEDYYGINKKIILGRVDKNTYSDDIKGLTYNDLALKYSNKIGAEMSIGAYLSNIDINVTNSIQDYAFTAENNELEEKDIDDDKLKEFIDNNINVDIFLSGKVRNIGGNLKDGTDLINQYALILLQQTCTDKVLEVLTAKISGQEGISKIYNALTNELSKYVNNGYLITDKVWSSEDNYVEYNGKNYLVIKKGTPLISGYNITILPFSSLTEEEVKQHKCPLIYLVLASRYGIRAVTIEGEVI